MKTKKLFILLTIGLAFGLSSCEKECFTVSSPDIDWKIGTEYDKISNDTYFTISFSASLPIEEVQFQSWWVFKNGNQEMVILLEQGDFVWTSGTNSLRGRAKTSSGTLLIQDSFFHKGTSLEGAAKINGKWYRISKKTLP